jgi:hypothetical protein
VNDETELLFKQYDAINGSIAVDFHPWTFLLGLSKKHHVVSSQGKLWREWVLWLGPICVTLTFYGGVK